ncbi:tripartite tricarboxylate transporter substrate binding protein [Ramlibacter sp. MAH-25]|uniref:Tripartite tricarboxylate transporter substrate binding protein n=2 Tax=Ramlibacter pinisoli TaxID=2682844 RepID=A0A6N8IT15_9BURK|nr:MULTISPECIES: tripartite tricarboxylate transporter substrate binding protein [Ramlibacter]MBA2964260.1 tripartite tricarboxylate transporter substrate binding protein [Ramlibacter sp. CGMCC 1.13660]MVQ29226.1 tripartite tricarboxylate transporter substrate binding protein [Ramlibacter pinisoli]
MDTLSPPSSLRRRHLVLGGLAAAAAPWASAQGSSDTPVRLIVPFTPGTGIDLIARQIGPALSDRLKRPFFVENKAGASGNIGTQEVTRATPDGTTLLVSVNTLVMNMALYPKAGFDPLKDLAPVSLTSWGQLLLVANPGTGIDSLKGLVERAKAKPGALNYGSPGAGTPHHLAMELLKNRAKVSLTHISYRGTAPAVTDLLGGQIDVMFLPIHVALQHVKAGKLKALAISSTKSSPLLPDVPPLNSLNLGDMNVDMWYGVLAPAGTPQPFIERLNTELRDILALPAVAKAFETQGMTPAHSTPDQFRQVMVADAKRWADLIKAQKITAE